MAVKRTPEIVNITTNYRADMKKYIVEMHPQRIKCNKENYSYQYSRDINFWKYFPNLFFSNHVQPKQNRCRPANGHFLLNISVIILDSYMHTSLCIHLQRICSVWSLREHVS